MEEEGFLFISVRLWHEIHTMKSMKLCLPHTGTAFSYHLLEFRREGNREEIKEGAWGSAQRSALSRMDFASLGIISGGSC